VDLFDVIRACFRRWYVVLPPLLITAWIANGQYTDVQPVYYANAVVGIAPPNQQIQYTGAGAPIPRNGLLDVGGPGLITSMTILSLSDSSVRAQVVAEGGAGNYTARVFPSPLTGAGSQNQLPLIMIEATESDKFVAGKTVELAAGHADSVMQELQKRAGVPDSELVRALIVSPPTTVAGIPSRSKSVLYVVLLGIGIALFLGVATDVILNRRKGGRNQIPAHDKDKATDETPPEADIPAANLSRPSNSVINNK